MNECEQLGRAIAALEAQRATLGDEIVDASIAALREKLVAFESAKATMPELRGEHKLVTVMFADISGFTTMSEQMDPEAIRDLINACFECLVPVIQKYDGTVDKFIGDNIMALFGAPIAHEDDPARALHAALEMADQLGSFNRQHSTSLALHFGINTGHVIAGGLGTRERQEYSVMGDAVNLASRLEDASERGEILVGSHTYRLAAPLFEFEALDPIRVQGKTEPVQVYRLIAVKDIHSKVRGIEGLTSALVGRDAEVQALRGAVERVQAGVGGIVTVVGEAGVGKSRLVAEVRKSADLQWTEGCCLSYGGSIAYLLWLDVLRGLLGVTAQDTPVAVRDTLREWVRALCPDRSEAIYPYLGQTMSLPLESKAEMMLRNLDGADLKLGTFRAMEAVIEQAAQRCSLIIVCEDLHWADPTSIELLERLLPLADRVPVLFVCVFRLETSHGCWRIKETAARLYRHRHTDLWLDPLSTAESETLVGNLLRAKDLPQALWARILGYAEGNPFYVEEIIRSLIDSGAIAHDQVTGRWQMTRKLDDIVIPDTLHGVLVARIDRLQKETKYILQLASVIGRVFFHRVLTEIAQEERELDTHLLTLQREEMIRERTRIPELEYIFKHHLTQEAAYNGLLKKKRRAYHRQVAEALERLYSDRIREQAGLLAHHWERTGEAEAAFRYLVRAGRSAQRVYANEEAVAYFKRALALLDASPGPLAGKKSKERRLELLRDLAQVCSAAERVAEAEAYARKAIVLGKEMALTPHTLAQICYWLGELLHWQNRPDDLICVGEEGLALLGGEAESIEATLMKRLISIGQGTEENAIRLPFPTQDVLDDTILDRRWWYAKLAILESNRHASTEEMERTDTGAFDRQLGDLLMNIMVALYSGYNILQTFEVLAEDSPEPARSVFRQLLKDVQQGQTLEKALDNSGQHMPSTCLHLAIAVIKEHRARNENLAVKLGEANRVHLSWEHVGETFSGDLGRKLAGIGQAIRERVGSDSRSAELLRQTCREFGAREERALRRQ